MVNTAAPSGGRTSVRAPDRSYVANAVLSRARELNVLFSAVHQSMFVLNENASRIWRQVAAGLSTEEIVRDVASWGVSGDEARAFVHRSLSEWHELGLITPAAPRPDLLDPARPSRIVAVAGLRTRISFPLEHSESATVFEHLERAERDFDLSIDVIEGCDRLDLFRDGEWAQSCAPEELPVVLKGILLSDVLEFVEYEIALHAATLLAQDRAVLLLGPPGRGKTTLALGLMHKGYGLGGDDVVLLKDDGRCQPLPFAPAIKSGTARILKQSLPAIAGLPVFRRPDNRRVRYLNPVTPPATSDPAVGWVFLLDRSGSGEARLEQVDAGAALGGLIEGAYAVGEKLSNTAFEVLASLVDTRPVFRLSYSRMEDGIDLIAATCR